MRFLDRNFFLIRLASIASLLVMIILAAHCGEALAAQPNGWLLRQSSRIAGNQVTYICPTGMKVDSLTYTTIVLAPKFTTTVYNKESKCYLARTYQELKSRLTRKTPSSATSDVRKGKLGMIAGLSATQFFLDKMKHGKKRTKIEFWVANDFALPTELLEYWAKTCEIPSGYGLPLRVVRFHNDGRTSTLLNTVSCTRTAVSPSSWKAPTGYKQVRDEMSVLTGISTEN